MLGRIKRLWLKHKIASLFVGAIALCFSLIALYCLIVIFEAQQDTPKVIRQATAPDKLRLRTEDFSEDDLRILLAVEDPNFYTHNGIDLTTPGAGWTTLTQGIVKIYFYNGFTPGLFRHRKVEQSLIAWVFNRRVDKRTQLLIFINSAYFGNHEGRDIKGFADAARGYFSKDFAQLTRDEYLALVAMIIGPNEFNIKRQPDKNRERVKRINRLLSGECKPRGLTDVYYEDCG